MTENGRIDMNELEIYKIKRSRTFSIISAIIDPLVGIAMLIASKAMKESYKYYWDSGVRDSAKLLSVLGWFFILAIIIDIIVIVNTNEKIRTLESSGSASSENTTNRTLWHCPDCGNMISRSAVTCPNCGRPISAEQRSRLMEPQKQWWKCPDCGTENSLSWDTCVSCGRYRYQDELD